MTVMKKIIKLEKLPTVSADGDSPVSFMRVTYTIWFGMRHVVRDIVSVGANVFWYYADTGDRIGNDTAINAFATINATTWVVNKNITLDEQ